MHTDSEMTGISHSGSMHYMTAVSLEMSDVPKITIYFSTMYAKSKNVKPIYQDFWSIFIENAKKIRICLVVCENMYIFAAVFQIYVDKEQCCNKE